MSLQYWLFTFYFLFFWPIVRFCILSKAIVLLPCNIFKGTTLYISACAVIIQLSMAIFFLPCILLQRPLHTVSLCVVFIKLARAVYFLPCIFCCSNIHNYGTQILKATFLLPCIYSISRVINFLPCMFLSLQNWLFAFTWTKAFMLVSLLP